MRWARINVLALFFASSAFGNCPHPYVHFEAFQSGDRIAYCAPLPDVVAEFNRHNKLQMALVGGAQRWPTIDGDFLASDVDEFVEILVQFHKMKIVSKDEHLIRLAPLTGSHNHA